MLKKIVISQVNEVSATWYVSKTGEKCLPKANGLCIGVMEDVAKKKSGSERKTGKSLVFTIQATRKNHPLNEFH